MNIDERLTALAESVELLTLDVREMQPALRQLVNVVAALVELQPVVRQLVETSTQLVELSKNLVVSQNLLTKIAADHEARLRDLEKLI